MTNEERVEEYFKEIEDVFGTKEKILNSLNNYDNFVSTGDTKSVELYDGLTLGRHMKEHWVLFKINEPNLLNSFLMSWVVQGKKIAGVEGQTLDFGNMCRKDDLKKQLIEQINEL